MPTIRGEKGDRKEERKGGREEGREGRPCGGRTYVGRFIDQRQSPCRDDGWPSPS